MIVNPNYAKNLICHVDEHKYESLNVCFFYTMEEH